MSSGFETAPSAPAASSASAQAPAAFSPADVRPLVRPFPQPPAPVTPAAVSLYAPPQAYLYVNHPVSPAVTVA